MLLLNAHSQQQELRHSAEIDAQAAPLHDGTVRAQQAAPEGIIKDLKPRTPASTMDCSVLW